MLARTLKRAGTGFLSGMAVGNVIAFIFAFTSTGNPSFMAQELIARCGSEAVAFLVQTLLAGVIGAVAFSGMSFFEIDEWSILRAALTHFILICAVYFPTAYFLFWVVTPADFIFIGLMMLVGYVIVWLIMCAVYRAQVKELNTLQEQLTDADRLKQSGV